MDKTPPFAGVRIHPRLPACFLFLAWTALAGAIDISPSKYQGGNSNNVPYKTEGAPSLLKNPFNWIFGPGKSEALKRVNAPPNFKVELALDPPQFHPSTNAVLKARMTVINESKEKYILEFDSAQHYEFLIRNKEGKEFYRSSQDKVFSQQFSSTVANPHEKLIFEEDIFSPDHPSLALPPGQYTLIGNVTAKKPVSAEALFQVIP